MKTTLAGLLILACAAITAQSAAVTISASGSGPAPDPFRWADFGGTPDVTQPSDLGLTEQELSSILDTLGAQDRVQRERALLQIRDDVYGSEAVFRKLLWGGHGARNTEMKDALRVAENQSAGKNGDLLTALLGMDPGHQTLGKGATASLRILAMLHALNALDTMAAYKIMIEFSPRYAGLFRAEIGRLLVAHGIDALPALVYGRKYDDVEIHMFCVKWIRDLGNPLLSEQVKLKNPRRLAQLLEAYAAVKDLDVVEVTLSLTNHESFFVRTAARKCVAVYGANAKWAARVKYENTIGKEPGPELTNEQMLAQLYAHYDEARLARSNELFGKGLAAAAAGKLEEMERTYREVLRNAPMFPRRHEMATGFIALATVYADKHDQRAERQALVMARRLAENGSPIAISAEAKLSWQSAENLRRAGIADHALYATVANLDTSHTHAAALAEQIKGLAVAPTRIVTKSLTVALLLFMALLLAYRRLLRGHASAKDEAAL